MFENEVLLGTCLDRLKEFPAECIDSYVSDVPYGLGGKVPTPEQIVAYLQGADLVTGDFMGKDWDIPSVPVWKEIYRVLKPGSYAVVFGGTRTFDLVSMGIRMAGFECRDTIAHEFPQVELPILQWCYASGMPKSRNIGKALATKGTPIEGEIGTGLKPAWEPILLYRKLFKGTVSENVLEHGTGGLNIGVSRVKHASLGDFETHKKQVEAIKAKGGQRGKSWKNSSDLSGAEDVKDGGRWPANFVLTHADCQEVGGVWQCVPGCPVAELDTQSGNRPSTLTGRADPSRSHSHPGTAFNSNSTFLGERTYHSNVYSDSGGASRFFKRFDGTPFRYVPKANRLEAGCGEFEVEHPTLKPTELMRYLINLVTPPGGIVLDSHCGSGSTCHAAYIDRYRYVGIERDKASWEEACRRMEVVKRVVGGDHMQEDLFEEFMS